MKQKFKIEVTLSTVRESAVPGEKKSAMEVSLEMRERLAVLGEILSFHVSDITQRTLRDIALEVEGDWKRPYFGAEPYINAMKSMEGMDDVYGLDPAKDIVARFLCNANTWRGPVARRVKDELRLMLKGG